jgi:hypothetical protein
MPGVPRTLFKVDDMMTPWLPPHFINDEPLSDTNSCKKAKVIDPQIKMKEQIRNERMTEHTFTLINLSPTKEIKTGITKEKTPINLLISISERNAPPTPVQFFMFSFLKTSSEKSLLSILLWSTAPVKKKETIDNKRYTAIKSRHTPTKK